jgi:hypothetical protein
MTMAEGPQQPVGWLSSRCPSRRSEDDPQHQSLQQSVESFEEEAQSARRYAWGTRAGDARLRGS